MKKDGEKKTGRFLWIGAIGIILLTVAVILAIIKLIVGG